MITKYRLLGIGVLLIVAACAQQPVEQAPEQTEATRTPFAVGSTTRFIRDTSRRYDSVAGVYDGIRTLVTEVWYPISWEDAESGDYRQATYGDYVFGDSDAHRRMMTQTTFFHLTPDTVREGVTQAQIDAAIDELFHRKRASYVDAPVAKLDKPIPVIVMSHGDAGSRYNMESACEYLAAHGYLVIAPEHAGNSPYSMSFEDPALSGSAADESTGSSDSRYRRAMEAVKPHLNEFGSYGEVSHYGQSYSPLSEDRTSPQFFQYMDASFLQRVNDLRATLDELTRMSIEGPFAGTIDWKRAGLMGRSFGGATTLAGLALEPRFVSGLAVVPPSMPDIRPALPPQMLKPADTESLLLSAEGPFGLGHISKPTFLLSGAEDTLIIGLAASMATPMGLPVPTPDNPHPVLRAAYESAQVPVIWGLLANSNHASFGVSGGYWWPDLKPQTQQRHFEPEVAFDLVDVKVAHQIQKEKALAFFDLTVRGDASAKARLMSDQFANQGLTLEARNLDTP